MDVNISASGASQVPRNCFDQHVSVFLSGPHLTSKNPKREILGIELNSIFSFVLFHLLILFEQGVPHTNDTSVLLTTAVVSCRHYNTSPTVTSNFTVPSQ